MRDELSPIRKVFCTRLVKKMTKVVRLQTLIKKEVITYDSLLTEKNSITKTETFWIVKIKILHWNFFYIFLIFAQTIDCG